MTSVSEVSQFSYHHCAGASSAFCVIVLESPGPSFLFSRRALLFLHSSDFGRAYLSPVSQPAVRARLLAVNGQQVLSDLFWVVLVLCPARNMGLRPS